MCVKFVVYFSCGTVGQLFCHTEQQIGKMVSILNKVKYDNDGSLEKLEKVLADLRYRCLTLHLQQSVYYICVIFF